MENIIDKPPTRMVTPMTTVKKSNQEDILELLSILGKMNAEI
jgi:hypothetical protein